MVYHRLTGRCIATSTLVNKLDGQILQEEELELFKVSQTDSGFNTALRSFLIFHDVVRHPSSIHCIP